MYGRGANSIAEQLGKTKDEAQEIIDKFNKAFPVCSKWISDTIENARSNGYVEDVAGRRRRLPDMKLPKYSVKYIDESKVQGDFNPFLICEDDKDEDKTLSNYLKRALECRGNKQYEALKQEAFKNNVLITNNSGFIAQAERQCVNARIQGSAATLTKAAMIQINNNARLKEIGAYLISTVHDEVLIEAPEEYAEEAANLLTSIMVDAAKQYITTVPMACDPYIVDSWYSDEYTAVINNEYKVLIEGDAKQNIAPVTENEAYEIIKEKYSEFTFDQINTILGK